MVLTDLQCALPMFLGMGNGDLLRGSHYASMSLNVPA